MTKPQTHELTQLLIDWNKGDQSAFDRLMPLIGEELRRLAHLYMSRERGGHTLQTTALVNEAFVRLVNRKNVNWQNRAHFFGIAAQLMRTILVDHARSHACAKR
ncbi:MAG TPA: ECF-type sigma factor [Pyrinomonadaceae bacterium]